MTTAGEARIHERLDEIVSDGADMKRDLAVVAASCRDCRPKVLGNGTDGLDKRVDRLEQTDGRRIWWLVATVAFASSVASGLIIVVANVVAG